MTGATLLMRTKSVPTTPPSRLETVTEPLAGPSSAVTRNERPSPPARTVASAGVTAIRLELLVMSKTVVEETGEKRRAVTSAKAPSSMEMDPEETVDPSTSHLKAFSPGVTVMLSVT